MNASLVAVIGSLLVVGFVSHTPIRHVIQVVPGLVVLGLALARIRAARFAALAVFVFWLVIMALIWMYLLGIASIVTGHFTRTEIVLTVIIGVASAIGIVASFRGRDPLPTWPIRLVVFVAAAAFQVGAVLLSVQPMFEKR
jgi:hypothetical protein